MGAGAKAHRVRTHVVVAIATSAITIVGVASAALSSGDSADDLAAPTSASELSSAPTASVAPSGAADQPLDANALIEAGVHVIDDESAPVGSGLTLTSLQAERLVVSGAGFTGAQLESIGAIPEGTVPLSYLLAAWVSTEQSPAAVHARALMGTQDWSNAPALVFPAAVVAMFVADLAAAGTADAPGATSGYAPSPAAFAHAAAHPDGAAGGCSAVNAFLAATFAALFDALYLGQPAAEGPSVDGVLERTWAGAAELAAPLLAGQAAELTPEIYNAIRISTASLGLAVEVVTYFQNNSLSLQTDPLGFSLGMPMAIGNDPDVTAAFMAFANTATRNWSPAMEICAASAGVELPPLLEPGLTARWQVVAGGELLRLDGDTSTVDAELVARIPFRTGREPEENRNGMADFSSAIVQVQVVQPEAADFLLLASEQVTAAKDDLLSRLDDAGADPALSEAITTAYEAAIEPIQDELEAAIDDNATSLFTLHASFPLVVTYHFPATTTTSSPPMSCWGQLAIRSPAIGTGCIPPTPPPSDPPADDAFCNFLRAWPGPQTSGMATMGNEGLDMIKLILPITPADMLDEINTIQPFYDAASRGDLAAVGTLAVPFEQAWQSIFAYCGLPGAPTG